MKHIILSLLLVISTQVLAQDAEKDGKAVWATKNDARVTKVGAFIRNTRLDELPQLYNVFKGDMSFVGPRPLLPHYIPLYSETQRKRHKVKPGITGWAQVMGRNAISWEKKFEYDVWYVRNQSFILDLKILIKTVKKVIFKEDINTEGVATTTPFTGSK